MNRHVVRVLLAGAGVALIAAIGWIFIQRPSQASGASAQADYLFYNDLGRDHLGVTISGTGDASFAWASPSLGIVAPAGSITVRRERDGSTVLGYRGPGSIIQADIDTLTALDMPNGKPDTPATLIFVAEISKDGKRANAVLLIREKEDPASSTAGTTSGAHQHGIRVKPRVLVLSTREAGAADKTVSQVATAMQTGNCSVLYDVATDEWQAKIDRASFLSGCPTGLKAYGKLTRVAFSSQGLSYSTEAGRSVATGQLTLTIGSGASVKRLTATIDLLWEGGRWRLKSVSGAQ